MPVIGFVKQENMMIKDNEGNPKKVSWFECHFRIPGLVIFKAKLSKNNNKLNEKAPDYYLNYRANVNMGDNFRDISIGALWLKEKINPETGEKESYMTGYADIALKRVNILIRKPKLFDENEKLGFLYEIIAFNEQQNNNKNSFNQNDAYETQNQNNLLQEEKDNKKFNNYETITEEEIPF